MNKHFTLAAFALLTFFCVSAQQIKMVPGEGMQLRNTTGDFVSHTKNIGNKPYEDFSSAAKVLTVQKGSPALPVHTASVIIPDTGGISLNVSYDSFEEFDNVEVLPSKGSLKRNIDPAAIAFDFGDAYQQDAFYPGTLATASSPYILRDTRGVTVSFFPYQYNPVTKKLRVYRNITANVAVDSQITGVNENIGGKGRPNNVFNDIYQNYYINSVMYEPASESGEMLIITPQEYVETIAPLADWKTRKGIRTTVVTLADTGSNAESIKDYIQGFYNANPGLVYVLLVGDHENLPSYTYGISGGSEELWSDSYFGQLEGDDYYPEALVGRFSGDVEEVATMVNRTLEYEIAPLEGNWITRAIGIGSNEGDGIGDDGEPDWQHVRNIGYELMNSGYSYVHEFYDGSHGENDADGSPEPYMISDALNSGAGLLNYTGHGAQDVFVTGWYTSDDVMNLENNHMYPFVISVACNNGTFANGTSLCEAWLTVSHNNMPAGAIAAAGSSVLMAWAEPMQTQDEMTELIAGSEPENKKTTMGGLFYNGQISMLEAYGISGTAVEVMQTWVLFGDPSVTFRSREASHIMAEHVSEIDYMADAIDVQCNVEGALVAITQNGVILGTGIVSGGVAHIVLSDFANSTDTLDVTVTQQNFIPYEGTVAVETLGTDEFNAEKFYVYPNPARDFITVRTVNGADSLEIRDMTGKLVYISNDISEMQTINTSDYASGVYLVSVTNGTSKTVKKIVIR